MARKTKEEAEKTRLQLMDSALSVFLQKGYSKTTLQDIAAHAGVTRGAVYWHFTNKKEIYCAVLEAAFAPIEWYWDANFDPEGNPLDTIEVILLEWFRMLSEDKRLLQVLELDLQKTEKGVELADVVEKWRELDRAKIRDLADILRIGMERGQIRDSLDPLSIAVSLWAVLIGHAFVRVDYGNMLTSKDHAKDFTEIFLCGLRPDAEKKIEK